MGHLEIQLLLKQCATVGYLIVRSDIFKFPGIAQGDCDRPASMMLKLVYPALLTARPWDGQVSRVAHSAPWDGQVSDLKYFWI